MPAMMEMLVRKAINVPVEVARAELQRLAMTIMPVQQILAIQLQVLVPILRQTQTAGLVLPVEIVMI